MIKKLFVALTLLASAAFVTACRFEPIPIEVQKVYVDHHTHPHFHPHVASGHHHHAHYHPHPPGGTHHHPM